MDAEIEGLTAGLQARLIRLMEMVESVGLEQLHEPHVKHLEGKLWELRAKAMEGIARGSVRYCYWTPRCHSSCICQEIAENT
ncbi:type II toxin-antitoxin system RelE/ParE family toxin [Brucella gallinifaecis]|uniref:type II toxin-antitoxin system RelE/ParE family toxin n=1 Tax=Brucella gallinifaecis TaxID=215590 RepID=UPI0023620190|nr:type II toxin-antitoxin system RelE/ParE family toxin [Brucella gallinifaecis]